MCVTKKHSIDKPKTVIKVIGSFYLPPSVPALFDTSSVKKSAKTFHYQNGPLLYDTDVTSTETCYYSKSTSITFTDFCWGKPKEKNFQKHKIHKDTLILSVSIPLCLY
jgi:hypothetical protein